MSPADVAGNYEGRAKSMVAVFGAAEFEPDWDNDLKNYTVWFPAVHGIPAWRPLYLAAGFGRWTFHGIRRTAELLHIPTTKGWELRYVDGYPYLTVIETTEEERRQREPIFREKIKPFIEDLGGVWRTKRDEVMQEYDTFRKSFGIEEYEAIKNISNIDLLQCFDEFQNRVDRRQWEIHFEVMVPAFYVWGLFEQMCREILGFGHNDPRFSKLVSGFDSSLFRCNKEIWRLGVRAAELGLEQLCQTTENSEQLMAELGESEAGRKWLGEYREFLRVNGWRCERMIDWATPSWIEKPSLGLPSIKVALTSKGVYTLDQKRERAIQERKEAEREIVAKVPAEKREWFTALMKASLQAGYYSEDHTFYQELYAHAIGRWITREYGRRFAAAGCIDDPEDVYFLLPEDIRRAAISMGKVNLRFRVEPRRKEWEGYIKTPPKPFYGKIERAGDMARRDPLIMVAAAAPVVREDIEADLYSAAATPGVVEGVARVIMTEDKLHEVKPGEILVAPGTSAPWTPAFEIISGLITDGGGALSHAIIVAREYGIPCVAGTVEATRKIKTGDRVKIDGNEGVAYILSKS
jgi:pyruvate,water dikinase